MSLVQDPKLGVVIPCYRVVPYLEGVLASIPAMVDHIIVVDDACPDSSGLIAQRVAERDKRITVVFHEQNQGVGGAVISGYRKAMTFGCDIVVKLDGDGQMNPDLIPALIAPLVRGSADYAKGNRFRELEALGQMPKVRLFGNSVLSFLVKAVSGYWNVMDPTNGFTAIHRRCLDKLDLDCISRDFFFESDMLVHLNLLDAAVHELPMKAQYGDETSSLKIGKVVREFPLKLIRRLTKRVFFKYFVYDFNMASVYILAGVPMLVFGMIFGVVQWIDSALTHTPKTAGTIMVAALPVILAFQMLLQAIQIDINRTPGRNDR
ncbi:MAG: glycosyltransferase family 2 protein [Desulfomonile tiedjei]|nr:glycosyltransferase family 2 protein [Desulfomonile tiedjei]